MRTALSQSSPSQPPAQNAAARWTLFDRCNVCGSRDVAKFRSVRDVHYGITGEYDQYRCASCGLLFLNPMPSEAAISRLYPETYYSYQGYFGKDRLKELLRTLTLMRSGTKDPDFRKPGRLLDIGCGSGWYLRDMRDKGWEVHGVEVSDTAAAVGRREANLDIFGGTLHAASFPADHFDFVRANHAFEHIIDPHAVLDEIRRILRPGGKLLLAVPNVEGLAARIAKQYWWHLCAPVHVFGYSPRTLTAILEQHGLAVETVKYNSDFSGIIGSLQIYLNRNTTKSADDGHVIRNPVLRILGQRIAKILDVFHLGDAVEIVSRKP